MLAQSPNLTLTSASGDSSLQMYGLLDLGVGKVDHSYSFSNNYSNTIDPRPQKYVTKSATGMFNGGISGDRIGFRGATKIDDNWKAIFNLEAGINLQSGTITNGVLSVAQNLAVGANSGPGEYNSDSATSGQLFGRAANFGVASDLYGTLTAGRNTSLMLDTVPNYDALQGAQEFTPIGYSGTYGGGGETDNSRIDSSVKYKFKVSDFSLGLLHKFSGVSGSTSARGVEQVLLGWEPGNFGISLIYEGAKDAASVGNLESFATTVVGGNGGGTTTYTYNNPGQVAVSFYDTTSYMALLRYKIGNLALKGGYIRQEFKNPSNPGSDLTMTSIFGQVIGKINVQPQTQSNGIATEKVLNVGYLGAAYDITPKFNAAVAYYHVAQNDFSDGIPTAAEAGSKSGSGAFASVLLDYRYTKAFDTYLGYMGSQYRDGMAAGYTFSSNKIIGIGARYAF
jgi:predicted porin